MTVVYNIADFSNLDARKLFVKTVFGDDWPEKGFFLDDGNWSLRKRLEDLDDARGCYWCIGAIPWGKSRKIVNVEEVRALVIDDVGTKVDAGDAMSLDIGMPTAIVGTSEKNFQYVYRFGNPPKPKPFNRFREGLLGHLQGACDGKDAAHLFRLPWGLNLKPGRGRFAVNGRFGLTNNPDDTPYAMKANWLKGMQS